MTMNWLEKLLAAESLGHGRAVETMLAGITGLYGVMVLLAPVHVTGNPWIVDPLLLRYGWVVAVPFLLKALMTGYGVKANIRDWPASRYARFGGALIGSVIWFSYIAEFIKIDILTIGFPCVIFFAFFSIRIMGMAIANRPHPGAVARVR